MQILKWVQISVGKNKMRDLKKKKKEWEQNGW